MIQPPNSDEAKKQLIEKRVQLALSDSYTTTGEKLQKEIRHLEDAKRLLDEDERSKLSPREQFYSTVDDRIGRYQREAKLWRWCNTISQIVIIILSIIITSLTSGLGKIIPIVWITWLTPVLGIAIGILTGIMGYFKFRDRGYNAQLTANAIESEKKDFELGINDYEDKPSEAARTLFIKRIRNLIDEQKKRQLQLEQSSDYREAKARQ